MRRTLPPYGDDPQSGGGGGNREGKRERWLYVPSSIYGAHAVEVTTMLGCIMGNITIFDTYSRTRTYEQYEWHHSTKRSSYT